MKGVHLYAFKAKHILKANKVLALSLLFITFFATAVHVFATPPGSPYAAGATLDPSCSPGDTNCTADPVTIGTFSASSISNGASYSAGTLTFGPADASNPGLVSTGTQTWAGAKTFSSAVNTSSSSGYQISGTTILSVAGTQNVLLGASASGGASGSGGNTVIGNGASGGTGTHNTVVGQGSGRSAMTGDYNTILGSFSSAAPTGGALTSGSQNVLIGAITGPDITTGGSNIFIGDIIGSSLSTKSITTGSYNIIIGSNAGAAAATGVTGSIGFGDGVTLQGNHQIVFGDSPNFTSATYDDLYLGHGAVQATAGELAAFRIHGTGIVSGSSNISASASTLSLAGAIGTGTGTGGDILVELAYPGSSGSSQNSFTTVADFLAANKQSSGTVNMIALTPTVNQSGTAGYTGLLVNVTQTATGSGTKRLFDVQAGGSTKFNVASTGNVTVTGSGTTCTIGDGTGTTSCTSDARLKQNVTTLSGNLDRIMQLRPVTFNWNSIAGHDMTVTHEGFIAQEVQQIFPDSVHKIYDDYLGIDYGSLVVPLAGAIQELDLKIRPLTSLDSNTSGSLATLISAYLGSAANGLQKIFVGEVHTNQLCVGATCVNEAQLQQLLQNQPVSSSGSSGAVSPPPADDSGDVSDPPLDTATPSDTPPPVDAETPPADAAPLN